MKVNFSKEHLDRLKELSFKMLKNNSVIRKGSGVGTSLNINDLFHVETESSLRSTNAFLLGEIDKKSKVDTWSSSDQDVRSLNKLKEAQELVNLLIGYKISKRQSQEARAARQEVQKEIEKLEKETMKPEERIAKLKKQLEDSSEVDSEEE